MWATFAARYPEVTAGDLAPGADHAFVAEVTRLLAGWLDDNHPDARSAPAHIVTLAGRDTASPRQRSPWLTHSPTTVLGGRQPILRLPPGQRDSQPAPGLAPVHSGVSWEWLLLATNDPVMQLANGGRVGGQR
jgi:hypothetical protein